MVVRASVCAWREISRVREEFGCRPLVVVRGSVFSAEVVGEGPLRLRLKEFLGFGVGSSFIIHEGSVYSVASRVPLGGLGRLFRAVPGSRVGGGDFVVEAGPPIEPGSSPSS